MASPLEFWGLREEEWLREEEGSERRSGSERKCGCASLAHDLNSGGHGQPNERLAHFNAPLRPKLVSRDATSH